MRHTKKDDGLYHLCGKTYPLLVGSRCQVGNETAYKTVGNLTKSKLIHTKDGRWRSRCKHNSAKKDKRLEKAGYFTKKGKFGSVRRNKTVRRKRKH